MYIWVFVMFTRFENGTYTYYTSLEFDRFIRTTKITQQNQSNKYTMPLWLFCSNIVGSDFVSGYHHNASTHRLPSECLNYGNIHRSGLFNIDIDDLSDDEICALKDLCKIDNNIKYCAKSYSGHGVFILYYVGINNQFNPIYVYNNVYPEIYKLLKQIRRSIVIDNSSLYIKFGSYRIESYDPEPYNNFGDTQW